VQQLRKEIAAQLKTEPAGVVWLDLLKTELNPFLKATRRYVTAGQRVLYAIPIRWILNKPLRPLPYALRGVIYPLGYRAPEPETVTRYETVCEAETAAQKARAANPNVNARVLTTAADSDMGALAKSLCGRCPPPKLFFILEVCDSVKYIERLFPAFRLSEIMATLEDLKDLHWRETNKIQAGRKAGAQRTQAKATQRRDIIIKTYNAIRNANPDAKKTWVQDETFKKLQRRRPKTGFSLRKIQGVTKDLK